MREKDANFPLGPIDLKSLEKQAFRSTFEDGLWDIFFGALFMGIGIIWSVDFELAWFTLIIHTLISTCAILFLRLGKKYMTTPRLGSAKFSKKRRMKRIRLKIFLLIFLIINIVVFFFTFNDLFEYINLEGIYVLLIMGSVFVTIPFIIIAYYLDFKRLYFIAILGGFDFFLFGILDEILGKPWSGLLSFFLLGICIIMYGLFLFFRFLKAYEKPEKIEAMDEGISQEVEDG